MSNVAALTEVLDHVETNPDRHDQAAWVCGTTACLAGWAVALHHGHKAGDLLSRSSDSFLHGDWIPKAAEAILGLTHKEGSVLFGTPGEKTAIRLGRAIAARDKGDADAGQRSLLAVRGLPTEPAGDAATWTPGGAA